MQTIRSAAGVGDGKGTLEVVQDVQERFYKPLPFGFDPSLQVCLESRSDLRDLVLHLTLLLLEPAFSLLHPRLELLHVGWKPRFFRLDPVEIEVLEVREKSAVDHVEKRLPGFLL
jgi:hypothetical protein